MMQRNLSIETKNRPLVIGTRGSALARWQTEFIAAALTRLAPDLEIELRIVKTAGDRDQTRPLADFGGLGVFTKELDHALLTGEIDLAVHSLKDLPTDTPPTLAIAAIPAREDARDVLVSRHGVRLMQLPPGARIGTSSARRTAQLLALRPDLTIVPLRGNIDTRLRKAQTDEYDAIILAAAGLLRLGRAAEITEYLAFDTMLPDPGQGALAVQVRSADAELAALLAPLDDAASRAAVLAERAFLRMLGGGCRMPMGALAQPAADGLWVRGMVGALDGSTLVRGEMRGALTDAEELGTLLAKQLLRDGAAALLGTPAPSVPPLQDKRIIITRAPEQAGALAAKIRAHGGHPVEFPTIEFAPLSDFRALDDALAHIAGLNWVVFTSANGVRAVAERLRDLDSSPALFERVHVAAIGPGTARALAEIGVRVDFIPTKYLGEQIARELPIVAGEHALLLRADIASDVLANLLAARGVTVSDVDAYQTRQPTGRPLTLRPGDAITFTSSSTVRHFVNMLDEPTRGALRECDVFCIGPVTATTARELGLPVAAVAVEHTLDGLVAAMLAYYERK